MREIISVHIGQAGVNIGHKAWEIFGQDHGIGQDGVLQEDCVRDVPQTTGVFFRETEEGKHNPRAVFMDTEP
jgi:tubulin alpha